MYLAISIPSAPLVQSLVVSSTISSCSSRWSLSATMRLDMECSLRAEIRSQCSDPCSIYCLVKRKHFRSKNCLVRRRNCYPLCSCSTCHLARCRHHHSNSSLLRKETVLCFCCSTRCLSLWNMLYLLSQGTCSQLLPTRSTCFLEPRNHYRSTCCLRHKENRCRGHFGSMLHRPPHKHHRSNENLPRT